MHNTPNKHIVGHYAAVPLQCPTLGETRTGSRGSCLVSKRGWLVALVLLPLVAAATACSGSPAGGGQQPSTASPASGPTAAPHSFGPIYMAGDEGIDPLVAKTLASFELLGRPADGGEIRGYLVDWTVQKTGSIWTRELALMKDGSLFLLDASLRRPGGAFGASPTPRLGPEPAAEARARTWAVATADRIVTAKRPGLGKARPQIFAYLIRLRYLTSTTIDVWVDPSGNSTFLAEMNPTEN